MAKVINEGQAMQQHQQTRAKTENTIPIVSLKEIQAQDSRAEQKLGNALRDVGFFALVDHGLSQLEIEAAYRQVELLFSLPIDVKDQCSRPDTGGQVGFTRFLQETAKDAKHPDLKEYWHIMRPVSQLSGQYDVEIPDNVWPKVGAATQEASGFELDQFKITILHAFKKLDAISRDVLSAISVYIDEPRLYLPSLVEDGYSVLRLLNYPRVEQELFPGSIRAAAHEDINFITLLVSATSPGLELQRRDGSWMPVVAPEGAIIIDSAVMLANLTNGLLKATTHRVVNNSGSQEARYSMPFFVHPRQDVSLNPRKRCIERHPGGRGRDITAKAFLRERLIEIGVLSE